MKVVRLSEAATKDEQEEVMWTVSGRRPLKLARRFPLLIVFLAFAPCAATAMAEDATLEVDRPLENRDVLAMVSAGVGESVILAAVQHAPRERLDTAADALTSLRGAGVPEAVVTAIVARVDSRHRSAPEEAPARALTQPAKPKSPDDVRLFFAERPTEPFRELGRVSVQKYSTMARSRKRDVIDKELRTKAFELGGDAVINITEDFASVSGVVVAFERK